MLTHVSITHSVAPPVTPAACRPCGSDATPPVPAPPPQPIRRPGIEPGVNLPSPPKRDPRRHQHQNPSHMIHLRPSSRPSHRVFPYFRCPKSPVPHPFAFLLAKGREITNLDGCISAPRPSGKGWKLRTKPAGLTPPPPSAPKWSTSAAGTCLSSIAAPAED